MKTVNALGEVCPIPIVMTKNAIKEMTEAGKLEVLVDNETSVQNLMKMAKQKGYPATSEKLEEGKYHVLMDIPAGAEKEMEETETVETCPSAGQKEKRENTVVVISSGQMGNGDDELGGILIKAFTFALTQMDKLPSTMLFYNGGVKLTCEGGNRSVRMSFPFAETLGFWHAAGTDAPYICIEPWLGTPDPAGIPCRIMEKEDILILPPGGSKTLEYSITVS